MNFLSLEFQTCRAVLLHNSGVGGRGSGVRGRGLGVRVGGRGWRCSHHILQAHRFSAGLEDQGAGLGRGLPCM